MNIVPALYSVLKGKLETDPVVRALRAVEAVRELPLPEVQALATMARVPDDNAHFTRGVAYGLALAAGALSVPVRELAAGNCPTTYTSGVGGGKAIDPKSGGCGGS